MRTLPALLLTVAALGAASAFVPPASAECPVDDVDCEVILPNCVAFDSGTDCIVCPATEPGSTWCLVDERPCGRPGERPCYPHCTVVMIRPTPPFVIARPFCLLPPPPLPYLPGP